MSAIQLFAVMCIAHFLADYPLQGDFLSKAKNRFLPIPGVPWYQAMGAHAIIQGGLVWMITGNVLFGALETIIHAATDDTKCSGRINFNMDQAIHIACKAVWAFA